MPVMGTGLYAWKGDTVLVVLDGHVLYDVVRFGSWGGLPPEAY